MTPVLFAESNSEGNSNASSGGSDSGGNSSSSNSSGSGDSAGNSSGGSDAGGEGSSGRGSGRVSLPKTSGSVHREGNTWHISFESPGKPGGGGNSETGEGSGGLGGGVGQTGGGKFINPAKLKKESAFFEVYITKTVEQIGDEAVQDIEEILSREGSLKDQIKAVEQIVQNIEGRIRQSIQNPSVPLSYPAETKSSIEEHRVQVLTQQQEMQNYRYALQLIITQGAEKKKHFNNTLTNLSQEIDASSSKNLSWGSGVSNEQKTLELAMNVLHTKYDQRQLGVMTEPYMSQPHDLSYTFVSPEGDFLRECHRIYAQIQQTHPFNEQGVFAKDIALAAVETADQLFAKGDTSSAKIALYTAEIISDITLGFTPYIGLGKDIYELFTGKHLLTGRTLTLLERAISAGGIVVSLITGGTFGSSILRFSISHIEKVFGEINSTLLTKILEGLANDQLMTAVVEYKNILFQSSVH